MDPRREDASIARIRTSVGIGIVKRRDSLGDRVKAWLSDTRPQTKIDNGSGSYGDEIEVSIVESRSVTGISAFRFTTSWPFHNCGMSNEDVATYRCASNHRRN